MKKFLIVLINIGLLFNMVYAFHELGHPIFITESKMNLIRLSILFISGLIIILAMRKMSKRTDKIFYKRIAYFVTSLMFFLLGITIVTAIYIFRNGEYLDSSYELFFAYPYNDYFSLVIQFIGAFFGFNRT